jgi:cell division transport system permease protein
MAPGASIDDHKKWLAQFSNFVGIVQFTLLLIAILIISTTACIVIFACKTSLKIHRGTVALLHRLGAFDSYIATQFQNYAAALTLKGAFIGSGFASITLLFLHFIAHSIDSPLFPSFVLSPMHWLILFTLPLLMSGLALLVARMSVLANLRRAP